jgi:hypothetical protein
MKNQYNRHHTVEELKFIMQGLGRERIIATLVNPFAPHLVKCNDIQDTDFLKALEVLLLTNTETPLGFSEMENISLLDKLSCVQAGLSQPSWVQLPSEGIIDRLTGILDDLMISRDNNIMISLPQKLNEPIWPYTDQDTRFRILVAREWLATIDGDNEKWKTSYYRDSVLTGIQKIIERNQASLELANDLTPPQWYPDKSVNPYFNLIIKPQQWLGSWQNNDNYHVISYLGHGLSHDMVEDVSDIATHLYRGLSFPLLPGFEIPNIDAKLEYDILEKWLIHIKNPSIAKKSGMLQNSSFEDLDWDD